MAIRKIVKIDETKCDGCGQCIVNCPEGALRIIDGKARLVREDYCDGLGACLGVCPCGAIVIEQREAERFDEEAVKRHMASPPSGKPAAGGCPSLDILDSAPSSAPRRSIPLSEPGAGELTHWPIQLALVPPNAPFLYGADLLLAADCAPAAAGDFHARFLRGRRIVLACPKLDQRQPHIEKLAAILRAANLHSLMILRMEVPCCAGLNQIVKAAMQLGGVRVPVTETVLSRHGDVLGQQRWE
jgi:NAD-dependent dihydropyrimidine dehydrogenase PreA subunit